ncbi:GntR family transcriptional regulator [Lacticaseibacillus suihuaensis]
MPKKDPIYVTIADQLKSQIRDGTYRPGDQLPTEKELVDRFSVSRVTARKSLDALEGEGLIERFAGRGTFVKTAGEDSDGTAPITHHSVIGVVLPEITPCFGTHLLFETSQIAQDNDLRLFYMGTRDDQYREAQIIRECKEYPVDGLIIWPVPGKFISSEILKMILSDFPVVLLDRYVQDANANFVSTDNKAATRLLLDHLINIGHRTIAVAQGEVGNDSSLRDRVLTAQLYLSNYTDDTNTNYLGGTLTLPAFDFKDPTDIAEKKRQFRPKLRAFIATNPNVTAFFIAEYYPATFLYMCLTDLGYRVPDDFSIACFDSPDYYLEQTPRFTHIHQREKALSQAAVTTLKEAMANHDKRYRQLVDVDLVVGDTTGAPRS